MAFYLSEEIISLIGSLAGICTTIAFLPQVIKVWRTKSSEDISLLMFLIFCTGIILWLVYGILLGDFPLIIANTLTLILSGSILYFKIRNDWAEASFQSKDEG